MKKLSADIERLTPEKRAVLELLLKKKRAEGAPRIAQTSRSAPLALSFAQQRLWFLDRFEGENAVYNIPMSMRVKGALDVRILERTLSELVRRHEALRTVFALEDGQPVQKINAPKPFEVPVLEVAGERDAIRLLNEEARIRFDLERGPLFRAKLLRLAADDFVLLLSMHHIVSDGWSVGVLLAELSALYSAFAADKPSPLPELPIQYADWAAWQRQHVAGELYEKQLTYWKETLAGAPPVLELAPDHARPPIQRFEGRTHRFEIERGLASELNALSRSLGATPFMTLLAAFSVLLARRGGQDDLLIGTPIANRTTSETEPLIGVFINSLVMRAKPALEKSFRTLVEEVKKTALDAYANQDLPFEGLIERLQPVRSLSHSPLFQVMFILQNAPRSPLSIPGLEITPMRRENTTAKFDLTLSIEDHDGAFAASFEYNVDLFDAPTIERFAACFRILLASIVAAPDALIGDLEIVPAAEQKKLLQTFNDTRAPYDRAATITRLFEAQCARAPQRIAARFGEKHLTYLELDRRANGLAHRLRKLGVKPGVLVGISLERGLDLLIALFGVMKAGGAYVPLDPSFPRARLEAMIEDSGIRVVVGGTIQLDDSIAPAPPLDGAIAEDLAYVLYTSGSTGKPKGVEIPHRSVVNFLASMHRTPGIIEDDVLLAVTTISFDIAGLELYLPLIAGACVVIAARDDASDGKKLLALLEYYRATILQATPATWRLLLAADFRLPNLTALVGGEALPEELALELAKRTKRAFNMYGPTETTIWSTMSPILPLAPIDVTIGRPIANTRAYVVDPRHRLVPIGVPGELLIGGDGVARGYRNREELTKERFIESPFEAGAILYRTGDRVKMRENGALEFLGRFDHQVKLRGFRIELGEIEVVLNELPGIEQAVLVLRQEKLVAYFVPRGPSPDAPALRAHLGQKLPEYMIPSAFFALDSFPLTPNGKIDRAALPDPETTQDLDTNYVLPRTPEEEILVSLYSSVLRLDRVSVADSFFHLGGHSLLATQLLARIRDSFDVELPLRTLFEAPSIAELAPRIAKHAMPRTKIERADRTEIPLSFAQQRLWLLERIEGESGAYNIPLAYRLSGTLDVAKLARALTELVARHETLRSTFPAIDGRPVVLIAEPAPVPLPVIDVKEADLRGHVEREARRTFDLSKDPPMRATLLRVARHEHVLLYSLHHIAADGWSLGLLLEDLSALYSGSALAPLTIQYTDFAVWQRRHLDRQVLDASLAHFQKALAGAPTVIDIAADRPRPPVQRFEGGRISVKIEPRTVSGLEHLRRETGTTLYMTLLSAFAVLLSRRSGQEDLLIGSPIANRTHAETEILVGCFINTLVMRAQPSAEKSFFDLLHEVKRMSLDAYAHQDLPFEALIERMQPQRSLSHSPLFQVMFILQNTRRGSLALGDCALAPMRRERATSKYDLTLEVEEKAEGLIAAFEYNLDLFDEHTIVRMAACFQTLLAAIAHDANTKCGDLAIVPEAERTRLLQGLNDTRAEYDQNSTVADLFAARAVKTPENIAATYADRKITYRELDRRANGLAHRLRALGVERGATVGIALERGLEMLIALFGVLKAGGAYVPLDPAFPAARIDAMIEDSGMNVIIGRTVSLDAEEASDHPPPFSATADDLAYVLYTSGSTGKPKGVEVRHRSLMNFLAAMQRAPGISEEDVLVAVTTISFDIAGLELYLPLISGARVVLASRDDAQDGKRLLALIEENRATMLQATPATWRVLFAAAPDVRLPALTALVGGEALPPELALEIAARTRRAFNMYGPTETTIWSTMAPLSGSNISIGGPIANTQIFVTDARRQLVPLGVPGELLIGGHGLARGYRGRADLTAEKFVESPFPPLDSLETRLYRTGDRVRMREDGSLEFLGRLDHQIKLRGFRIELGEIENVLAQHDEVAQTAVVLREDRLVAYFVARRTAPQTNALKLHLRAKLPEYMVPSTFVALDQFPLTPNGKIDRRALPSPDVLPVREDRRLVAPRNTLEKQLAEVFQKTLGVEQIGVHESFFDLGGHSLLAVTLLDRIEKIFKKTLPLMALFRAPTVAELAPLLGGAQLSGAPQALEELHSTGTKPPLFFIGSTPYARALIPYLGLDQPVYGLNIFGLYGAVEVTEVDVLAVAAKYVQEIRAKQPTGSYRLCAYCADTKLALAVAHELVKNNCDVSMLAFIDTIWTVSGERRGSLGIFLANIHEFGFSFLAQKLRRRVNMVRDWVAAKIRKRRVARAAKTGEQLPIRMHHRALIRSFLWAMHTYAPEPFRGRITLFLSRELRMRYPSELDRIAGGGLEIHEIPGFHDRVFVEPQINVLAEKLRACLDRADASL